MSAELRAAIVLHQNGSAISSSVWTIIIHCNGLPARAVSSSLGWIFISFLHRQLPSFNSPASVFVLIYLFNSCTCLIFNCPIKLTEFWNFLSFIWLLFGIGSILPHFQDHIAFRQFPQFIDDFINKNIAGKKEYHHFQFSYCL